jgi:hypothetical protein
MEKGRERAITLSWPGFDPAIHLLRKNPFGNAMDPRVKPGGDEHCSAYRRMPATERRSRDCG